MLAGVFLVQQTLIVTTLGSSFMVQNLAPDSSAEFSLPPPLPPTPRPRTFELDLIKKLTGYGYSKLAKPVQSTGNSTLLIVRSRLYIIRIQYIDEAAETLHSSIRIQLNWHDPRLSWYPRDFGGMRQIVVPSGLLWAPQLSIANSVSALDDFLKDSTGAFRLHADGNVWYHPTGKASTRCKFDLTYYPFDIQRCIIIVESLVYQFNELRLITRTDDRPNPVSLGMLAENEVWELVTDRVGGVATYYRSGERTSFSRVQFSLVMKRKSAFFVVTVVIPTIVLALITLLTYLVPVHYVDRPVQSVTTVLAVAIFEVTVAEKLPNNSANCLLTIYLTIILCSSAITILATTICLSVVDPGEFIQAPWGLPNIYRAFIGLLRCKRTTETKYPLSRFKMIKSSTKRLRGRSTTFRISRNSFVKSSNDSKYEPGRRLTKRKAAWFAAYAVNWIGFAICLIATVSVPLVAFFKMPKSPLETTWGDDHLYRNHSSSEIILSTQYYGDFQQQ